MTTDDIGQENVLEACEPTRIESLALLVDPGAGPMELYDSLSLRLTQAQGVVDSLSMLAFSEGDNRIGYAAGAAGALLAEVDALADRFWCVARKEQEAPPMPEQEIEFARNALELESLELLRSFKHADARKAALRLVKALVEAERQESTRNRGLVIGV